MESAYASLTNDKHSKSRGEEEKQGGRAGLASLLVFVSLALGVALWLLYAYKNPQTSSGQFLIKYRPAQWRFNGNEARYTAASIHM